ncbi:acyl-CoA dehydrogenase family protein [Streptomyces sp. NPDC021096]|uniref:acyl-CoA dehydrogenase family protein n=1 Tax=Streptomyces sp. NPDC021096 TaxID=3154792 RepID=UPI0033F9F9C6
MRAVEHALPASDALALLPDLAPALEVFRARAAASDEQGRPDPRSLEALRTSGLLSLAVPREYGGVGAGAGAVNDAVRLVAGADASLAIVLFLHCAVTARIARWGTERQKQRYLSAIAAGECLAASVWSEQKAGASKAKLGTQATSCGPDTWRVQGNKTFATGAGIADVYLVLAQSSDGGEGGYGSTAQSLFLVDAGTPGAHAHPGPGLVGMRSSATGFVSFEDCRLPGDAGLGQAAQTPEIIAHPHHLGYTLGAVSTGIARAALDTALRESADRGLLAHQAMRHTLAEVEASVEAAHALVDRAGARAASGGALRLALHAKAFGSTVAESACTRIQQVLGSAAFVATHPVNRLARDARAIAHMGPPTYLCREMAADTWAPTAP